MTCVTINLLNRKIIEVGKNEWDYCKKANGATSGMIHKLPLDILFESLRSFATGLRQTVQMDRLVPVALRLRQGGITYMCLWHAHGRTER